MRVSWVNERGEQLDWNYFEVMLLHELSDIGLRDPSSHCLRYVDEYGTVIFSSLQMPKLLEELKAAGPSLSVSADEFAFLLKMVEKCQTEPGTFLRIKSPY